jgi:Tfp pilus assembly protein PilX
MRRARSEEGFALVSAIVLLTVILGLGMGLLLFTDNQQRASVREQGSESAFNVGEAALNTQVGQISRAWPAKESEAYPDEKTNKIIRCTEATTTTTNGCPSAASLSAAYPNISPVPCTGVSTQDAWGSPLSNQWTTYVRDDGPSSTYFNSTLEATQPGWDANGDGKMWIRSVAAVQCHVISIVTLVSRQLVALSFPKNAVSGNWFRVTNNGNKIIVSTESEGQKGLISMRCEGVSPCEEWDKSKNQVSPDTTGAAPVPSPILSEEQLAAVKSQAIALGTFRSPSVKGCPGSLAETNGLPAYIEGCGNLTLTGGVGNSSASPGFLVLADGTLTLLGNAEFFGVIYARNPTNSASAIVSLGGTSSVVGAIDVDGKGGIEFGSSGVNFSYNPKGINEVKAYAGATPTRNTFRILPSGQ